MKGKRMRKLKKILSGLLSLKVILLLEVAIIFVCFGEKGIRNVIEKAGTKGLNVEVKLDDVDLSPFRGTVKLKNLTIANPQGFQMPYLLSMGEGVVNLDLPTILKEEIVIDKIKLDEIHFVLEQKGLENNVSVLINSLEKSEEETAATPAIEEAVVEAEEKGKKLIINEVSITNSKVTLKLVPLPGKKDAITLNLTPITIKDIGKKNDVNIEKLSQFIIMKITQAISEQGEGIIPTDVLKDLSLLADIDPEKLLKSGFEAIINQKENSEKLKKSIETTGKEITDTAKGALESIGDIFKKKEDKE